MFKEKRFIFQIGNGPDLQVNGIDGKKVETGNSANVEAKAESAKVLSKGHQEVEAIMSSFMDSVLEKLTHGLTKEGATINPILTFLGADFENIISGKLKLGLTFEGFSEDGMIWYWKKDGQKTEEVNPVFLDPDVKELLNNIGGMSLHKAIKRVEALNTNARIDAAFKEVIGQMKQRGLIANISVEKNSDFAKDLLDILAMMDQTRSNISSKPSYKITYSPGGISFIVDSDKFMKSGYKDVKLKMNEYDSKLMYKPIEVEKTDTVPSITTDVDIAMNEEMAARVKKREEKAQRTEELFPSVQGDIIELQEKYKDDFDGPMSDERFEEFKNDLYEQLDNIADDDQNLSQINELFHEAIADIEELILNGEISSKDDYRDYMDRLSADFKEKIGEMDMDDEKFMTGIDLMDDLAEGISGALRNRIPE